MFTMQLIWRTKYSFPANRKLFCFKTLKMKEVLVSDEIWCGTKILEQYRDVDFPPMVHDEMLGDAGLNGIEIFTEPKIPYSNDFRRLVEIQSEYSTNLCIFSNDCETYQQATIGSDNVFSPYDIVKC